MDTAELIGKYVQLRDLIGEREKKHKEALAPMKEMLDKIAAVLHQRLDADGANSVNTPNGVAFKTTKTSVTVADKEGFMGWLKANDRLDLLDVRANKTAIVAYREEMQDLPPGLNWREEIEVQVRRA